MEPDLFDACVPEERLHPAFRELHGSVLHAEARCLMNELYTRMADADGNFLRNFQTDGFHSHLFELACFAYLEAARFSVDRSFVSPDFLATSESGEKLAFEATTANPTAGRTTDISLRALTDLSQEEITKKVETEFPRRMESILRRKLQRNYHELSHCQGIPLLLMVAPFFEAGAPFYTDESLLPLLYGIGNRDPAIPAFFDLPEATQISGVLYCNAFTVPRFFRMGTSWERLEGRAEAYRHGVCYRAEDESVPYEFKFRVGDAATPTETWAEGVTLFLNPNAVNPLPGASLPCTCTFSVQERTVLRQIHGFHPVASGMLVSVDSTAEMDGVR